MAGLMSLTDWDGERILQQAIDGDADAQAMVAMAFYAEGGDGFAAKEWAEKSANQGNAIGQGLLGSLYFDGEYVRQSYDEALRLYRLSANQGFSSSQNALGEMYYYGYGVDVDFAQAAYWFRKAADQDHGEAQYSLGYLYHYGQGLEQNTDLAKYWYGKACDNGSRDGCLGYKELILSAVD
ncbi:hypothetical protein B0181_06630 [Moraxella caviae]|nr:hypothetical protein B0181_06630 [Moraxella caviae]